MTKKIIMWAENMPPTCFLLQSKFNYKEDSSSNEFMKHFDKLVEKYPIIKEGEKECLYLVDYNKNGYRKP